MVPTSVGIYASPDCPHGSHFSSQFEASGREPSGLRTEFESSPDSSRTVELTAFFGLLFTAQPEAPAFVLAGASGWAVNDYINDPLTLFCQKWMRTRPKQRKPAKPDANAFRLIVRKHR